MSRCRTGWRSSEKVLIIAPQLVEVIIALALGAGHGIELLLDQRLGTGRGDRLLPGIIGGEGRLLRGVLAHERAVVSGSTTSASSMSSSSDSSSLVVEPLPSPLGADCWASL